MFNHDPYAQQMTFGAVNVRPITYRDLPTIIQHKSRMRALIKDRVVTSQLLNGIIDQANGLTPGKLGAIFGIVEDIQQLEANRSHISSRQGEEELIEKLYCFASIVIQSTFAGPDWRDDFLSSVNADNGDWYIVTGFFRVLYPMFSNFWETMYDEELINMAELVVDGDTMQSYLSLVGTLLKWSGINTKEDIALLRRRTAELVNLRNQKKIDFRQVVILNKLEEVAAHHRDMANPHNLTMKQFGLDAALDALAFHIVNQTEQIVTAASQKKTTKRKSTKKE